MHEFVQRLVADGNQYRKGDQHQTNGGEDVGVLCEALLRSQRFAASAVATGQRRDEIRVRRQCA